MTPEIYEALRNRISIISKEYANTRMGLGRDLFPFPYPIYYFSNAWLNPGLERDDENYIDGVIHQMSTNNIWNVCQRFYSLLDHYKNFDQRLLAR